VEKESRYAVDRQLTVGDAVGVEYDADFEIAAEVLPLRHQWVLEWGTI
jgi:hypothetical protein